MSFTASPARPGPKPKPHIREHLLCVGLDMLHANGYSASGIQQIVDAAGVPKGSFYNYFASKEAFCGDIIDLYFERHLPELRVLLRNPQIPPLERLRGYFAERIDGFQANGYSRGCLMGNLSLEMADQSDMLRARLAVHFRTWSELLAECIASAQDTGCIPCRLPAALLAGFVLNSWEGALLRMRTEKSAAPLHEFMQVVFAGLLVSPHRGVTK